MILPMDTRNRNKYVGSGGDSPGFFAHGVSFYKLFWIFFITSFIGAMIEILFMLVTHHDLQSRSSVIYGQFSLVWGLGGVLFTVCFSRLSSKRDLWTFLAGTFVGAAYEYVCSLFQELVFGASFWDYSHLPLNINGRVCLLFAMFWGLAAIVWVKDLYPRLCRLIGHIPNRLGKPLTWLVALFMLVNIVISAAALGRWHQREQNIPPRDPIEHFLDQHFPDSRIYKTYPTLKVAGTP